MSFTNLREDSRSNQFTVNPDDTRFAIGFSEGAHTEMRMEFLKCYIENYRCMDCKESGLSEYFAADFDTFTLDDLSRIPNNNRRTMRDFLRKRGVYV